MGNIHNLWYRAYGSDNTANAAIIPDIQSKGSIISLNYRDQDLTPTGDPDNPFTPQSLRLARSTDGVNWSIYENSVVDTTNKTVAIIDTLGGYYMIVSRVY